MLGCEPALWSALVLSGHLITLGATGPSSAILCHAEPRNGFCWDHCSSLLLEGACWETEWWSVETWRSGVEPDRSCYSGAECPCSVLRRKAISPSPPIQMYHHCLFGVYVPLKYHPLSSSLSMCINQYPAPVLSTKVFNCAPSIYWVKNWLGRKYGFLTI